MKTTIYIFTILLFFSCAKKEQSIEAHSKKTEKVFRDSIEIDSSEITVKKIKLEKSYKFEDYKVEIFNGKLAAPNFRGNEFGNDHEYVDFIQSGCKRNGINFAGHYTIIEKSCGALCVLIFVVDRIDGRIFVDTKPNDGSYGYKYKNDSKLLIANSEVFIDDSYTEYYDRFGKPEFYFWKKDNFVRLD